LIYLGILDTITLRLNALSVRRPYADFYRLYQDLDEKSEKRGCTFKQLSDEGADFKGMCVNIINSVKPDAKDTQRLYGTNKLFLSMDTGNEIDRKLDIIQKEKKRCSDFSFSGSPNTYYEKHRN